MSVKTLDNTFQNMNSCQPQIIISQDVVMYSFQALFPCVYYLGPLTLSLSSVIQPISFGDKILFYRSLPAVRHLIVKIEKGFGQPLLMFSKCSETSAS